MKLALASLALFAAASEAVKVERFTGLPCTASNFYGTYTLPEDGVCRPMTIESSDTLVAAGLVNEIKTAVNGTNFYKVSCAGGRFEISYFSDAKCTPLDFPKDSIFGHSIGRDVGVCHRSPASQWNLKYTCDEASGGPSIGDGSGNNSGNGNGNGNNPGNGGGNGSNPGSGDATLSKTISGSVSQTQTSSTTATATTVGSPAKSDAGHLLFSLSALVAGSFLMLL